MSVEMVKASLLVEPKKVDEAVKFYKDAFKAEVVNLRGDKDYRRVEIKIGSSDFVVVGMEDASNYNVNVTYDIKMASMGAVVAKALEAGAIGEEYKMVDSTAELRDPYGYSWSISADDT